MQMQNIFHLLHNADMLLRVNLTVWSEAFKLLFFQSFCILLFLCFVGDKDLFKEFVHRFKGFPVTYLRKMQVVIHVMVINGAIRLDKP